MLSTEDLLDRLRHLGAGRDTAPTLIQELRNRDMSLNAIAAETGIPRTTVQRWAPKKAEEDTAP